MNELSIVMVIVLLVCVLLGTTPVFSTAYQFLLLPVHAFRNHYRRAAPYLPRIAIIVPAWNEGAVIGASVRRLLELDYPADRLRIYVVDDASTDDTPDVVRALAARAPDRVHHLRRDRGGQGKAHTLNHGIELVLAEPWAESVLIMDADVIFATDSLRKMTRHLADSRVGAVMAYIAEGSGKRNYLARFIAIEYVLAQLASRRAQNVMGAVACLAGGAQLHSRENLEAIGGRIPTGTLAEDTVTTFESQIRGKRVVFEPHARVLAEEPQDIDGLWKQRLRWARGNVQITSRYRRIWFRPSRTHRLGSISFGVTWFSLLLLPACMVLASLALLALLFINSDVAESVFRFMWIFTACVHLFSISFGVQLDGRIGRVAWREALLFPGLGSLAMMAIALFPAVWWDVFAEDAGTATRFWVTAAFYLWGPVSMLCAWCARWVERLPGGRFAAELLIYIFGYGSLLCAITVDSYVKEWRRADASWVKTEKTGRIAE